MRLATMLLRIKRERTNFKRLVQRGPRSNLTNLTARSETTIENIYEDVRAHHCSRGSSVSQYLRQVYPLREPFASDRLRLIVLPQVTVYSTQCGSTLIYRRHYQLAETSSEKKQRESRLEDEHVKRKRKRKNNAR